MKKERLFTHVSIYIGTFMSCTFLLYTVALYVVLNNNIQMAKKLKHSLPNTWFAMTMFYLIYWYYKKFIQFFGIFKLIVELI